MTLGKVYLVGAGPGAVDLLTVRAANLLQCAHVVFYDRLVGKDILQLLPNTCEKIYVGKEPDMDSNTRQERVYTLMIGHARLGKTVVRLKGGDPFVFGRGSEELLRLRGLGIPVEVVPGISSAIAAPQAAWIPLTHRGIAASFGVFAGHPGDGVSGDGVNWRAAAGLDTAVFLMGVARLSLIVARLQANGRGLETPVAVISNATQAKQQVYVGTLADIEVVAAAAVSPATIVVGEVVAIRDAALAAAERAELQEVC